MSTSLIKRFVTSSSSGFAQLTRFLQLTKYPVLNTLEQRTQVPKSYAVLGGVLLLTFLHLINPLAAPISNLVGWALPAYLSFKALESPGHQDDVQWLTYWIVFGFFNFTESIALSLVLYYFPWYFAFKTVFILWLQLPAFRVSDDVVNVTYTHVTTL
jgi:receptor expression-enhancing protein 5/6